MPVYHFHLHDEVGGIFPDPTGTELTDVASAEREAMQFAGRLILDDATHVHFGRKWHLDVTNHMGMVLIRLDFTMRTAPGAMGLHAALPFNLGSRIANARAV